MLFLEGWHGVAQVDARAVTVSAVRLPATTNQLDAWLDQIGEEADDLRVCWRLCPRAPVLTV
jgi:hypothetical protein